MALFWWRSMATVVRPSGRPTHGTKPTLQRKPEDVERIACLAADRLAEQSGHVHSRSSFKITICHGAATGLLLAPLLEWSHGTSSKAVSYTHLTLPTNR